MLILLILSIIICFSLCLAIIDKSFLMQEAGLTEKQSKIFLMISLCVCYISTISFMIGLVVTDNI